MQTRSITRLGGPNVARAHFLDTPSDPRDSLGLEIWPTAGRDPAGANLAMAQALAPPLTDTPATALASFSPRGHAASAGDPGASAVAVRADDLFRPYDVFTTDDDSGDDADASSEPITCTSPAELRRLLDDDMALWVPRAPDADAVAPVNLDLWHLAPEQMDDLHRFLDKLTRTEDYMRLQTRLALHLRMRHILQQMHDHVDLRDSCLELLRANLIGCSDRAAWLINQLDLQTQVHRAERTDQSGRALRRLGLRFLKLEVVLRHAAAQAHQGRTYRRGRSLLIGHSEAIEVHLHFQVALTHRLHLPTLTQAMTHDDIDGITDADLEHAAVAAEAAARDPIQVHAFLDSWTPWQVHLRRRAVAATYWAELQPCSGPQPASETYCSLTQQPYGLLLQPVTLATDPGGFVFELTDLCTWWQMHGTHPVWVNQRFELDQLRQLPRLTAATAAPVASPSAWPACP